MPWHCSGVVQHLVHTQFVRDRLRMADVRLYARDLLTEYAKLQRFKPEVAPYARCLDWARMLQEFDFPHHKDVRVCQLFEFRILSF